MIIPLVPQFIRFILHKLKHAGHGAWIVGGAVRDACLDRPIADWDVVTSASFDDIERIFKAIRHFSLKHGTVTLVDSGRNYELSTFREEGNTLDEDLARRDFTINAMAYDCEKDRIIDPYGGKLDLAAKTVRAVIEPAARFQEDPLRLLRGVRLVSELNFRIEKETLRTLILMSKELRRVARERIQKEFIRILLTDKPSIGLNLMNRTGLMAVILPELFGARLNGEDDSRIQALYEHAIRTVDRTPPDRVLRLAALLHGIAESEVRQKTEGRDSPNEVESAKLLEQILRRLTFSRDVIARVGRLLRHHVINYEPDWNDGEVRGLIRKVGTENIMDLLSLRRADLLAHGLQSEAVNRLAELEQRVLNLHERPLVLETRDLAVDGNKVMQVLKLSPGPEVGKTLHSLLERVIEHPEMNTQERLVAILMNAKENSGN